jgi:hypothetical protein
MSAADPAPPSFVIKADELPALNYLDRRHPRPRRLEWVNRGTNQKLRPTSIEHLLRTLFGEGLSPSVMRLHESAGLRAVFDTEKDRFRFAQAFEEARSLERERTDYVVSATFDNYPAAERAVAALKAAGIPDKAISLLWRTSEYIDPDYRPADGHSAMSVAGAVVGSGVAGAMLGAAILFVPGIGLVATAGALAASAFSSIATVSGVIGAAGGAVAKMLTDHDVDGVSAKFYDEEVRRGKVFASVDIRIARGKRDEARRIFAECGGFAAGGRRVGSAAQTEPHNRAGDPSSKIVLVSR